MLLVAPCLKGNTFCRYSVVKRADNSQLLLVATERTASMAALLGTELESVGTFTGKAETHIHTQPQTDREQSSGCFSYKHNHASDLRSFSSKAPNLRVGSANIPQFLTR